MMLVQHAPKLSRAELVCNRNLAIVLAVCIVCMFCYCVQQAGGAAAQLQQQLSEEVITIILNIYAQLHTLLYT
jgi:succinate dehydrogenase hydrophobic anchor subunit